MVRKTTLSQNLYFLRKMNNGEKENLKEFRKIVFGPDKGSNSLETQKLFGGLCFVPIIYLTVCY